MEEPELPGAHLPAGRHRCPGELPFVAHTGNGLGLLGSLHAFPPCYDGCCRGAASLCCTLWLTSVLHRAHQHTRSASSRGCTLCSSHDPELSPNPNPIEMIPLHRQVESFEEGQLISRYVNNPGNPHNVKLAGIGLDSYLKMLLKDNFIHADLHPGNILVRTCPNPHPYRTPKP